MLVGGPWLLVQALVDTLAYHQLKYSRNPLHPLKDPLAYPGGIPLVHQTRCYSLVLEAEEGSHLLESLSSRAGADSYEVS